ncbi:MAG TPA: hypothetical protein VF883_11830 [Thermoanaerobaculia bacterium]|jgi:hypothetical protein
MSEKKSPPSDADSQPCVACGLPIKGGVTKCVHCGSLQGWRRHITTGNTFLALLVALVSVLTMSAPVLRDAFRSRNSKVSVTYAGTQGDYLFLVASNDGRSPGTVAAAEIAVVGIDAAYPSSRTAVTPPFSIEHNRVSAPVGDAKEIGTIDLVIDGWDGEATFIQPGENKRLRARVAPNSGKIKMRTSNADIGVPTSMRCWLEVDVIQFDGRREAQAFVPVPGSPAELDLCWMVWNHRENFPQ